MTDLEKLAEASGISLNYVAETGEVREVSREGLAALLDAMGARDEANAAAEETRRRDEDGLLKPVPRCFVPDFLEEGRIWGVACQLYGLKSSRNWGIGDFGDLLILAPIVAGLGGDFIGLSPVHALFPSEPERCSPYSPSSKRFLNPLFIAPDHEPEYELISPVAADRLEALRQEPLVDYRGVAEVKWDALRRMFEAFEQGGPDRQDSFQAFRDRSGQGLKRHALFEALSEHFRDQAGKTVPWHDWPEEYRSPDGAGSRNFAVEHRHEVSYFAWLQWLADLQLGRAHEKARQAGLRLGLYVDLAVGVSSDSAETWADPSLVINGASIGAPPDMMSSTGQNWGLAPLSPLALKERDMAPLREELRSNMRHAGAVRLDHAMALTRLFWVPSDMTAAEGAYVQYPLFDMLKSVADASNRHETVVIAEALGTVPEGFTETLEEAHIHAYRVLFFERQEGGAFTPPQDYPAHSLACLSTHDLPTIRGWWLGRDLEWRKRLGQYDDDEYKQQQSQRAADKEQLWSALGDAGLVAAGEKQPERLDDKLARQIHVFVARCPSRLLSIQMEDALGEVEQANLPGQTDPHPNWRRKLPVMIDDLAGHAAFCAVCEAVAAERPQQ